jgi:hypothetical protein
LSSVGGSSLLRGAAFIFGFSAGYGSFEGRAIVIGIVVANNGEGECLLFTVYKVLEIFQPAYRPAFGAIERSVFLCSF